MILKIFLVIAVLLGLIWSFKYGNIKSRIITIGLALSISFVFIPVPLWKTIGLVMYMLFVVSAFLYGILNKGLSTFERTIVSIMTLPILTYWLFALNHFPGLNVLRVVMILSIILFLVGVIKKNAIKAELGFLLIFAMDAITVIMEAWMI